MEIDVHSFGFKNFFEVIIIPIFRLPEELFFKNDDYLNFFPFFANIFTINISANNNNITSPLKDLWNAHLKKFQKTYRYAFDTQPK